MRAVNVCVTAKTKQTSMELNMLQFPLSISLAGKGMWLPAVYTDNHKRFAVV